MTDWWTNGNNQISFGRGDRGFVAINRENNSLHRTFQTSLPEGAYCNVIDGDFMDNNSQCSGSVITVDQDGAADISLPPMSAAAIHIGAKIAS